MAREMFEEVKFRFLMVGHTHGDVDGRFGYLSKKLKEQNNYILADLMKVFMVSQERHFILKLIQEIPYFKTWVLNSLKDAPETLIGHINMHLFRFFVDSFGWPMM
jgi:hypothetical protein